MNKIDKLIIELCPDGVDFEKLGDILNYTQPTNFIVSSTIYNNSFETPVLTAGKTFVLGYTDEKEGIYRASKSEPVVIFDDFTTAIKWVDFPFKVKSSAMKILSLKNNTKYNLRYIYYAMESIVYDTLEHTRKWIGTYSKFKVPSPPIEIQNKIVDILDKFVELEAELEAREKQYEFYRGKILDFNGDYYMLKDLCLKTDNIKWEEINNDKTFQYIDLSSVNRQNNKIIETRTITKTDYPSRAQRIIYNEDVIFGTTRPTLMRYCFIPEKYDNQICSTGYSVLRANRNLILPKYLYYILTTKDFYNYIEENQEGASYPAISDSKLKKYSVSIPCLEEQDKIVSILDKFDKLINDISAGLPAEINMQKKQYEYYRDKLLNFKEV